MRDKTAHRCQRAFSAIAAISVAAIASIKEARAAMVEDPVGTDAARQTLAAQYQGRVGSLVGTYPAGSTYPAGEVAGGLAVINSQWFLTAKHLVDQLLSFNSVLSISTGLNWKNDANRFSIANIVYNPAQGSDVALIQVNGTLPNAIDAVFGTANPGDILTFVGPGIYRNISGSYHVLDGNLRAFRAPMVNYISQGPPYNNGRYIEAEFNSDTPAIYPEVGVLGGRAWTWDSGSGVFVSVNGAVELVSTTIYGTASANYGITGSELIDQAWVNQIASIPEPNSQLLAALGFLWVASAHRARGNWRAGRRGDGRTG